MKRNVLAMLLSIPLFHACDGGPPTRENAAVFLDASGNEVDVQFGAPTCFFEIEEDTTSFGVRFAESGDQLSFTAFPSNSGALNQSFAADTTLHLQMLIEDISASVLDLRDGLDFAPGNGFPEPADVTVGETYAVSGTILIPADVAVPDADEQYTLTIPAQGIRFSCDATVRQAATPT